MQFAKRTPLLVWNYHIMYDFHTTYATLKSPIEVLTIRSKR
jgi:hypothetical protein